VGDALPTELASNIREVRMSARRPSPTLTACHKGNSLKNTLTIVLTEIIFNGV
jgi:hypothetical protein